MSDIIGGASATTYMAAQSWKMDAWLQMMAESFKGADVDRDYFATRGSWTTRTTNIQRYARVDIYA